MSRVRVDAHAKVNLSLEVLRRRPDGFHEIRSVMQSIDLSDRLLVGPSDALRLECDLQHLQGEGNLVLRAARALQEATQTRLGAEILLRKGIPVAAGLGGASSDAAAVLVALVRLWRLPLRRRDLVAMAASLGSDVPFFLMGGTALVSSRGEQVTPLPDAPTRWVVLLAPPHSLAAKTAELYRRLGPECWSSGERTARLAEVISRAGRLDQGLLGNTFERVAERVFPDLAEHRRAMREAGASDVHLSGSGPTLFSLFATEAEARAVAARLAAGRRRPMVARTLTAAEAAPNPVEL